MKMIHQETRGGFYKVSSLSLQSRQLSGYSPIDFLREDLGVRIIPCRRIIMKNSLTVCFVLFVFFPLLMNTIANAGENNGLVNGQTVYVPAYSHIYSGNTESPNLLAVTLSIRNTDPNHSIEILSVEYYATEGKLLKRYATSPITLGALGTIRYTVPHKDKSGGSGANFIVQWKAGRPVNIPIVETIMIGARSSFSSRGQAILPSD